MTVRIEFLFLFSIPSTIRRCCATTHTSHACFFNVVHRYRSLNLSWSLIANLANLTIVLKHEGYDMSADWAVAWLIIAVLIGSYVAFTRFDGAYVFALCWALAGVASKQKDFFPIVASWATGSIVFVVLAFASALLLRRAGVIPVSDVEFEQLAKDNDIALDSASMHEPLAN